MKCYGVDRQGFIKVEVHKKNIKGVYKKLVDDVIASLPRSQVHSIYVYGSVARGTPKKGISDIDILVVSRKHITPAVKVNFNKVKEELTRRWSHLVSSIDLATAEVKEMKDDDGWVCI